MQISLYQFFEKLIPYAVVGKWDEFIALESWFLCEENKGLIVIRNKTLYLNEARIS